MELPWSADKSVQQLGLSLDLALQASRLGQYGLLVAALLRAMSISFVATSIPNPNPDIVHDHSLD